MGMSKEDIYQLYTKDGFTVSGSQPVFLQPEIKHWYSHHHIDESNIKFKELQANNPICEFEVARIPVKDLVFQKFEKSQTKESK